MEWFKSNKINDTVTEIIDVTGVRIFLIEGSKSAAVVDTGTGIGDLRAYIEKLTQLPYVVILSHGHVDHAGGAAEFDKVYLNQLDWELEKEHCSREMKLGYVNVIDSQLMKEMDITPYITASREKAYEPLEDGQIFDLGEITLEIVRVAGHTKGMCCILLKEERILILGDACNNRVFLFSPESTTVASYLKSLQELKNRTQDYDREWFSHGPVEQPKGVVDDCMEICKEILEGKDDKEPFVFMDNLVYVAKRLDDNKIGRKDGGNGNIVYDTTKIC